MSTDLHAQLDTAIRARLDLARAATPGPWTAPGIGDFGFAVHFGVTARGVETDDDEQGRADAQFIAATDPATVIRMCERDLAVIERHAELPDSWGSCAWCRAADPRGTALVAWPCPDLRDLAVAYGLLDPAGE